MYNIFLESTRKKTKEIPIQDKQFFFFPKKSFNKSLKRGLFFVEIRPNMKNRLMDVHDKIYRKGADFSRKRYGRFLQKVRTFVQKGTDFLPKRNAPFRRKTDRNKKTRMCFILVFTFSTIPFFSRCKKNAETTCIHIAVSAFMIVGVVSLLRGLTHQPIYLI